MTLAALEHGLRGVIGIVAEHHDAPMGDPLVDDLLIQRELAGAMGAVLPLQDVGGPRKPIVALDALEQRGDIRAVILSDKS
jgi:hypothetical protein